MFDASSLAVDHYIVCNVLHCLGFKELEIFKAIDVTQGCVFVVGHYVSTGDLPSAEGWRVTTAKEFRWVVQEQLKIKPSP